MDPTLLSLLDSIPQKPPRSKLETHRETDSAVATQSTIERRSHRQGVQRFMPNIGSSERPTSFVGSSSTPGSIEARRQRVSHLQPSPGQSGLYVCF